MKILVTGANGFIGKSIVDFLIKTKHFEIIATDIQESYQGNAVCPYVSMDITSDNFLNIFLKEIPSIDRLIHVGASLDMDNEGTKNIFVNCLGMQNIVTYAKKAGCKKFLYTSSIPIIGKPMTIPITEEHSVNPLTTYHVTKFFGEQILKLPCNTELNAIILRLPSPIGKGSNKKNILPVFIEKCKKNDDIVLQGKGLRVQNYVDVRDICNAVSLSIDADMSGVFNIAGEKSYSNLDLAKKCIDVLNSTSKIIFSGIEDSQEDFRWEINIDKAKKILRYNPEYSLEESIKTMV
jgi:UDP-glucose 4-epimerase